MPGANQIPDPLLGVRRSLLLPPNRGLRGVQDGVVADPDVVAVAVCVDVVRMRDRGGAEEVVVAAEQRRAEKGGVVLAAYEARVEGYAAGGVGRRATADRVQLDGVVL